MAPSLMDGDRVLVMRHFPPQWIKRGQVALLASWPERRMNNQGYLIKRVVGLAGDTLSIYLVNLEFLSGKIENGVYFFFASTFCVHTPVPYLINWNVADRRSDLFPTGEARLVKVPDEHLFVKGDSIMSGSDSIAHGPVPFDKIEGIMLFKLHTRVKPTGLENSHVD